jgi:hypothetical protein
VRSGVLANIFVSLASLCLSLAVLEIVARFTLPAPLPWRYPQVRYRSDPSVIFALRPNQDSFTADKPVKINSRGLRGPVIPYERTPGQLRLLFIGDSIAFGYGVRDEEVVTARVGALLEGHGLSAEVINASVPAYNTDQGSDLLGA